MTHEPAPLTPEEAMALVMNAEYVWHGYTCDLCDWGRDRAPASDEYARHLRSEHCVSDAERAGAGRLREAAAWALAYIADPQGLDAEKGRVQARLRAALDAEPGQPSGTYPSHHAPEAARVSATEPGPVDRTGPRGPVHGTGQPGQPR